MLDSIRKISKGPIGWVIFGIIFIPFLFFGIQSSSINSSESKVINVGDESLTSFEFNNFWQQELQSIQQQNFPEQLIDVYLNNLIRNLVSRLTIKNFINQQDQAISEEQVGKAITANPNFFEQGKFSKNRYFEFLSQNQIQVEMFENNVKDQLRFSQFSQLMSHALFLSDFEFSHLSNLVSQERSGGYQIFSADNLIDQIEISNEEALERYTINPSAYLWPAKAKLAYLLIDRDSFSIDAISDDEIRAIYQNQEVRDVKEIFIKDSNNPKSLSLANDLVERINSKRQSFSDLLFYTDNQEGLKNNGRLGSTPIERGMLAENFETVIFDLNEKNAGIVKTRLGYHILWVEKIYNYKYASYDQVKESIKNQLIKQKKNEVYLEAVERAKSINYDVVDNLEQISNELNLNVQESSFIDTSLDSIPKLLNHPEIINQIFSEILIAGSNSDVIELNSSQSIVFRHQEFIEASEKTFEEAKGEIVENLKIEKAVVRLKEQLDEKIANIHNQGNNDLSEIFNHWQKFENLDLNYIEETNLPREVVQTIFNLGVSSEGSVSITTALLPTNEIAVVELDKVSFKGIENLSNQEISEIENIHTQIINETIIRSFLTQLAEEYGVFISQDIIPKNQSN